MKTKVIVLFGCLWFFACEQSQQQTAQKTFGDKTDAVGVVNKDSCAAPKVILLTSTNTPKKVRAKKPPAIKNPNENSLGAPVFTNYDTEQGLAISVVYSSYVDKAGNLWFGTGNGLSCYNGKSFTNYTTAQGLADFVIWNITEDKHGRMWIGTRNGLSCYDGKSFTNYTTLQGLPGNYISSVREDRNGKIWIGTEGGLSCFDGKNFTNFTTGHGLTNNVVLCITEDRNGKLWIGTRGGINCYDGKTFTSYTTTQGLAGDIVRSVQEDRNGKLWFGTYGGLSCYNGETFTNYTTAQGLINNVVRTIAEDKNGKLWFGTPGGVSCFDGKSFTNYTTKHGLTNNDIWSIAEDNTGNLWFCTFGGGVSRFEGNYITHFNTKQGLANNLVSSIVQDDKGNIWFGSEVGGLSCFDGTYFYNFTTEHGLVNNNIYGILKDGNGKLWFGTPGGLSCYDGETFTNYTTDQGLASNHIWSMAEDKVGNIWIGTDESGVSCFDGQSFTNYSTTQGLAANNVQSIQQDKNGDLWFATFGNTVSRFDGKNFTNYTAQGLPRERIWNIYKDKTGDLWFSSEGDGLSRYDGKTFTNYSKTQGLANEVVYDMLEDTLNNLLWIGTNLGFSALELDQDLSDVSNKINIKHYNYRTGYPVKDLNFNAMLLDSKGILWGGCGDDKVVRFDYKALNKNLEPLPLHIQSISVNNENICWHYLDKKNRVKTLVDSMTIKNEMETTFDKTLSISELDSMNRKYGDILFDGVKRFYPVPQNLVLPYQHNNIGFEFVAIEPALQKQISYQYMLEGYDKEWSTPSNKTSANFGNIREGTYTFKVKARSPFGVWSETSYTFQVLPPWWRSGWAYGAYLLLLAFAGWRVHLYQKQRTLKREKEKTRVRELAQAKEIEKAYAELEAAHETLKSTQAQLIQSEKLASLGELTAGIAHEIQNPLNFVNNFAEVSAEMLVEMKEEIKTGNTSEIIAIADDLEQNLSKINHHGQRASSIVKGMLEHSRASTGVKEPTDINALADEFLRLAYHGLRAKDNNFNAKMETHFDPDLPLVSVIPQDIGRVLLNLINNAFYAVHQSATVRASLADALIADAHGQPTGTHEVRPYQPTITITTQKTADQVIIKIQDNGNGIPEAIRDKIFQPFFTTKPTGQGTGLGLSLAYDIVTKGHGGTLQVESDAGIGATFTIILPYTK